MHRLQDLVRLHRMGTGAREVARLLQMSPNTERAYRNALRAAGLLEGEPEDLPEMAILRGAVEVALPSKATPQHTSSIDQWTEHVVQMLDAGATPTAIYDRLRLEHEQFGGSLSSVKRLCARLKKAKGVDPNDVAIPVDTQPGHVAQVDFGSVGKLWDPETGKRRKAYVFVMVLGFSRHMFARIVFDQKVETWLSLHAEAFAEFGGVPAVVVPDNLKSAVIRAAFGMHDEPVLNRSYRELARHFGFKIDPTPAYSPEKKGKVESGVKYVKNNFFAARADEVDAETLGRELARWVAEVAGLRKHGTTHRRPLELFEQSERAALLSLPCAPWVPVVWRTPALRRDCHALVEGVRYSAPWRLIGRVLLARVTARSVELFWEDTRVATHERKSPGERSTAEEHLPAQRSAYRHRERRYWEERADRLEPAIGKYVREVFDSDDVLNQLSKVQAVVAHLEKFPIERAVAAVKRASFFGSYSYQAIKNILRKGLDMEPLPTVVVPSSDGLERPRFARDVQELLDFPKENNDAPH